MTLAPWWLDASCPDISYDDLERTRAVLADRQSWHDTVGEAHDARTAAGLFADAHASREWFHQLPADAPTGGAQIVWARRELAALRRDIAAYATAAALPAPAGPPDTTRQPPRPPAITPDRQLEIALAALEARGRQKAPDRGAA